jgi:hypothetical protein
MGYQWQLWQTNFWYCSDIYAEELSNISQQKDMWRDISEPGNSQIQRVVLLT